MRQTTAWIKRHPVLVAFGGAAIFYAVCTFYYMGGSLADCHNSLIGGVGDNTAGLIWLNSVNHISPFWGFTHVTDYPYGEQLRQPVFASGAAQYVLYWLLARLAGSVCGFNLLNAVGFMSASLIMFAFVRWLTRRSWAALLAGFAIAFTPYFQIKTGVHPSYIYEGMFVGILWLFLVFWRRPRLVTAIWLGALTALSFYWDPYFVLLSAVLWVGLIIGALAYELIVWRDLRRLGRRLLYGAALLGVFVLLLLPLAYIRLHFAAQINQVVTGSRNAIKFDAQIYSARPREYLLPVATQPVLKWLIPGYATHRGHHSSNPAEYTINLSLTLLCVIIIAAVTLAVRRWRAHRFSRPPGFFLASDVILLLGGLIATGGLAFIFSLPPLEHGYHLPTWYLTDVITMWRVFARLYVIVNLTMVATAAVALAYLASLIHRPLWRRLGWVLVFLLVIFEYQTFTIPRPLWSYSADVPTVYAWLHNHPNIHVVAEYPLDEPAITPWPTFYLSYQRISGKDLIDDSVAGGAQTALHGALRTLADPQTIPALRALGADTVLVHGVAGNVNIPSLKLVDYEAGPPATANPHFGSPIGLYPIAVYQITAGPKATVAIAPETGFVYPQKDSPISYEYVGNNGATLQLLRLPGAPSTAVGNVCFQAHAGLPKTENVTFRQSGRTLWSGTLTTGWQPISFPATLAKPMSVTIAGHAPASFVLHNLGCQP